MKTIVRLIVTGLVPFLLNGTISCQTNAKQPLYTIPDTKVQTVESRYVENMVYKIDIAIPENYFRTEKCYPTLYILDAWSYFGFAVQAYRALRVFDEVPEMLIIGISHFGDSKDDVFYRARDYTPTEVDSSQWLPKTGGASEFQQFIEYELFPFIENNYRTTVGDRAIFGASAGGIFCTYLLFNHPGMFCRYIIGGPAGWYDNYIVLDYEKRYSELHDSLPARIFMTVGSTEHEMQIKGWASLKDSMISRDYDVLEMTAFKIEDEGHISQALIAFIKGLKAVFK